MSTSALTIEEINAMRLPEIKSILKSLGVKALTKKKGDLVRLLEEYRGASTDESTIREIPNKGRDWLSKFTMEKLKRIADRLFVPKRNARKDALVDSIHHAATEPMVDFRVNERDYWLLEGESFKKVARVYGVRIYSAEDFVRDLNESRQAVSSVLYREMQLVGAVKYYETYSVRFVRLDQEKDAFFNSEVLTILTDYDIAALTEPVIPGIVSSIEKFVREGSGWVLDRILYHRVNIVKYSPTRGGSFLPLPKELSNNMKGLINIKNSDQKCLRWCHVRLLRPIDVHPERVRKEDRQFGGTLDYRGVEFPVERRDYPRIERQNRINLNVFSYEDGEVFPIYVSKCNYGKDLDVLLLTEGCGKEKVSHYVFIKDFNRLMFGYTGYKGRKHFCRRCLQCFSREKIL